MYILSLIIQLLSQDQLISGELESLILRSLNEKFINIGIDVFEDVYNMSSVRVLGHVNLNEGGCRGVEHRPPLNGQGGYTEGACDIPRGFAHIGGHHCDVVVLGYVAPTAAVQVVDVGHDPGRRVYRKHTRIGHTRICNSNKAIFNSLIMIEEEDYCKLR